jgi:hypothetical protein
LKKEQQRDYRKRQEIRQYIDIDIKFSQWTKKKEAKGEAPPANSKPPETEPRSCNLRTIKIMTDTAPSFPPPLVADTLQYRLDTGNIGKNGGQKGSLTRCAQKFGTFQSKLSTTKDTEEIETAKTSLVQELELYQLDMTKLWLLQKNLELELEDGKQKEKRTTAQLQEEQSSVNESQALAKQAEETKNCHLEYEALAKLASQNLSQPRRMLEQQIRDAKEELQELQEQTKETDSILKVRESQFQLLIQYMMDLKRILKEDESEQQQRPAKRGKQNQDDEEGAAKDPKAGGVAMDVDEEDGLYGDL